MKYGRLSWCYPAWWLDINFAAAVSASISLFTSTGRAGLFIEQMDHAIGTAGPVNIAFIPHTEMVRAFKARPSCLRYGEKR
jgi:hypothetical protein